MNMNCGFDLIELDTLVFWKSNAYYISLSMSVSVACSISCMLAKKFHRVQAEDTHIASNFTKVIVNTMSNRSGIHKSATNKLLQKRSIPTSILQKRNIPMPMLQKGNIPMATRKGLVGGALSESS